MLKNNLRLIGDVHGHTQRYFNLLKTSEYTLQLGDLGFKNQYIEIDKLYEENPEVCRENHKFIPGNHDDYDNIPDYSLGHHGPFNLGSIKGFFIRGAYSIDHMHRQPGISWWHNEELSYNQSMNAIEEYSHHKPDFMFSHDCPKELLFFFLTNSMKEIPNRTNHMLSQCFQNHMPRYWFFGHHHQTKIVEFKDTTFICLNELDICDIDFQNKKIEFYQLFGGGTTINY